jgi:hypothetical protein
MYLKVAEALADPYMGKIPLARVNAFQEPFASLQVIQQDTSNIRKANQYLKHTETCMKYSFPPIATEKSHEFLFLFIAVTPFLSSLDREQEFVLQISRDKSSPVPYNYQNLSGSHCTHGHDRID